MKTFKVTFHITLNNIDQETSSDVTAWVERAIEQQIERGESLHTVIVKEVQRFQNPNPPTGTDLQAMCKSILGVQS